MHPSPTAIPWMSNFVDRRRSSRTRIGMYTPRYMVSIEVTIGVLTSVGNIWRVISDKQMLSVDEN